MTIRCVIDTRHINTDITQYQTALWNALAQEWPDTDIVLYQVSYDVAHRVMVDFDPLGAIKKRVLLTIADLDKSYS